MVKKQRVINQATSGPHQGKSNLTWLPTTGDVKSGPIWEIHPYPIRLEHELYEQCERNHMQPASISGTGQIILESIELEDDQDQLVKHDEIIHIDDDDTDTDVQTNQKNGYTVEQLNPEETIQGDPPQKLNANCRVLLIKHFPPAWHTSKVRQFVFANTSAVSIVANYFTLAPQNAHSTHGFSILKCK